MLSLPGQGLYKQTTPPGPLGLHRVARCDENSLVGTGSSDANGYPPGSVACVANPHSPAPGNGAIEDITSDSVLPRPGLQVCWFLQQLLGKRERWLFKPALTPEQQAHLPEAVTLGECLGDPLAWKEQVCTGPEPQLVLPGLLCLL